MEYSTELQDREGRLTTMLKLGSALSSRQPSKAEKVFRLCIAQAPNDFRGFFNLASMLVRSGRRDVYDEAETLLLTANQLNPLVVEVHANLAGLQIKMGRSSEAIEWCLRGIALDVSCSECMYNLNVALRMNGRMQEALDHSWTRLEALLHKEASSSSSSPSSSSANEASSCEFSALDSQSQFPRLYSPSPEPSPKGDNEEQVAFVCVKWDTKYNAGYVNALADSLTHHWGPQARIICLTDDPTDVCSRVEVRALVNPGVGGGAGVGVGVGVGANMVAGAWRGWWLKGCLFDPALKLPSSPTVLVYLDLDTVILGPVSSWLSPVLAILTEEEESEKERGAVVLSLQAAHLRASEGRDEGINSSIIVWRNGACSRAASLFYFLERHYQAVTEVVYKFDHYLEMMLLAEKIPESIQSSSPWPRPRFRFIPNDTGTIADYSSLATVGDEAPPRHVNLVCFPLSPKPHEVKVEWVAQNWRYKSD